ncbi:MAG: hypothetical protein NT131_06920 [Methanomassiliicoccales archaeon]|nr:hypothetical protein [Methanomassiliicoccales archaeon]
MEGGRFCDRCGAPLQMGASGPYQQASYSGNQYSATFTMPADRKEPLIAVILSLLLPGVGQIYVGHVLRGVLILLLLPLFTVLSVLPFVFVVDVESFTGFIWWSVIASIISLVAYVWQIVDAYKLAEEHNNMNSPPRCY